MSSASESGKKPAERRDQESLGKSGQKSGQHPHQEKGEKSTTQRPDERKH